MAPALLRHKSLDALRAIAIGLVVLFHYATGGMPPERLEGFKSYLWTLVALGWSGVDLFFVLSGFLIGGILIDNRNATNFFRVFYVRRIARILPLYILAFGIAVWQTPELRDVVTTLFYAAFVQNIWMTTHHGLDDYLSVTWSLAVEEQFYLLAPLMVRFVPPAAWFKVLAALLVVGPVCRALSWVIYPAGDEWLAALMLLPCRIDTLAVGVLLAVAMRNPSWRTWLLSHRWGLSCGSMTCGLLAIMMVLTGHHWRAPAFSIIGFSLVAFSWAGVLIIVVTQNGPVSFALFRVLAPIGVGAYSIYLFHNYGPTVSQHLVDWATSGTLKRTALLIGFNLVVAGTLWRLIERPFIQLGHRATYLSLAPSDNSPLSVDRLARVTNLTRADLV